LADEDVAECEGVVGGGEDGAAGAVERDIGGRGPTACGKREEALACAGLRGGEGDQYGAGAVGGEGGGAVG